MVLMLGGKRSQPFSALQLQDQRGKVQLVKGYRLVSQGLSPAAAVENRTENERRSLGWFLNLMTLNFMCHLSKKTN